MKTVRAAPPSARRKQLAAQQSDTERCWDEMVCAIHRADNELSGYLTSVRDSDATPRVQWFPKERVGLLRRLLRLG